MKRRRRGCCIRGAWVATLGRTAVRGRGAAARGRVRRARKAVWGRVEAIVEVYRGKYRLGLESEAEVEVAVEVVMRYAAR